MRPSISTTARTSGEAMARTGKPLGLLMLVLATSAAAADAPPVDAEFLEFLGSDDSDDAHFNALLTAETEAPATESEPVQPAKKQRAAAKEGES